MAFEFVGEIDSERSGEDTRGVLTFSKAYRFTASLQSDDEAALLQHPSAPQYGSLHPTSNGAWCSSRSGKNTDPWKGWTLYVTWTSERELAVDPTQEPAIVTVTTEQFQRPADKDIDGKAICNSAGDPFDPPHMMDDSRRVISVQKNMSGHPSWLLDYQDAVNNDAFTVKGITYAAGVGKVQRVSISDTQTRNGVSFVVVSIDIHLQRDGWLLKPLDIGFREKISGRMYNILNEDAERITAPVFLDGAGLKQDDPTAESAIFGESVIYKKQPFSALPLT